MKMQLALLSLLVTLSGAYADDGDKKEEQTTVTEENQKTDETKKEDNKDEEKDSSFKDKLKSIFGGEKKDEDKVEE